MRRNASPTPRRATPRHAKPEPRHQAASFEDELEAFDGFGDADVDFDDDYDRFAGLDAWDDEPGDARAAHESRDDREGNPYADDGYGDYGPSAYSARGHRRRGRGSGDVPRVRRKKPRWRKALVIALSVLAVVLVGVVVYANAVTARLQQGLDPAVRAELSTAQPGQPFYMLLVGVDRGEGREEMAEYGTDPSAYRTDTMILARVDPAAPRVTLISILRDTQVDLGEYGKQKINAAYSIGGPALAVKVVSQFAGVPISHYAEVDFYGLCAIVDEIGGITVNVPVDVIDPPEYTGAHILAGEQTLNGEQALQLCRARHAYDAYGGGDFYRAANQRMVIGAIVRKVLHMGPIGMLRALGSVADSVTTDFDVLSLLPIAISMHGLNPETDLYSAQNPTESVYEDGIWWEVSKRQAWREMMLRVDQGLPPYEDDADDFTRGIAGSVDDLPEQGNGFLADPADAGADAADEATVGVPPVYSGSVQVLNASSTNGLAATAATLLGNAGFTTVTGNADAKRDTSIIYYAGPDQLGAAIGVNETLGGNIELKQANDPATMSTDVLVILGPDQVR